MKKKTTKNDEKPILSNKYGNISCELLREMGENGSSLTELQRRLIDQHGLTLSSSTLSRTLGFLIKDNRVERFGHGRSARYRLSTNGQLLAPVQLENYFAQDLDLRRGRARFNHDLFSLLQKFQIWNSEDKAHLTAWTKIFRTQSRELSPTILAKEFERVTVEFSWKSSAIEGNTYSLLDTENLLREGIEAKGKTKLEASMILNHKKAMNFIRKNSSEFKTIDVAKIETIHTLLTEELGISPNIRRTLVGITGTNYRPLDNEFQIREALVNACRYINTHKDPFAKAFFGVTLVSYIQPFEDGNKRTSRLLGNALLMAHDLFPLSYRSVDESDYKKAILLFYETCNLSAFKRLFLEQAKFAVETYFRSRF